MDVKEALRSAPPMTTRRAAASAHITGALSAEESSMRPVPARSVPHATVPSTTYAARSSAP
jgi:hypothetical protein